jgi:alanyl-tRNA synthetase
MNKQTLEIRLMFLNFFKNKGCAIIPSASLIPKNDSTLLFTSAGMVQFKDKFSNNNNKQKRVTSCQKCLRTSDIDKVGFTIRHLTFFEMLGNFSFGDYFKNEAVEWAWEFLTKYILLPKKKLYITVYKDDVETFDIWRKLLGTSNNIIKMGKETNFWDMGITGPCGPCSEILIDLGDKVGCKKSFCGPTCNCGRFLELWNLVFTQFDRQHDGTLKSLPQKNIDTGMGLERIVAVCNGYNDVFEIDSLKPIISKLNKLFIVNNKHINNISSLKIIADHIKAAVFLIADGVFPSNDGRGYVLRKIIRLAAKQGYNNGYNTPFLEKIVDTIINLMSPVYKELLLKSQFIKTIITMEEQKFLETLTSGSKILYHMIKFYKSKNIKTICGNDIYKLYDTYGLPYDITKEIIKKHGLKFDEHELMYKQHMSKNKSSNKFKNINKNNLEFYKELFNTINNTKHSLFTGYNNYKNYTKIVALMNNYNNDVILTDKLNTGDYGEIILTQTPFYAQEGGQVSDTGTIVSSNCECNVINVFKPVNQLIVHKIHVVKGTLNINDIMLANIDVHKRTSISIHHTSTHLLNAVLRKILGNHVCQEGSFVSSKYFHFDFTHFSAISNDDLDKIEYIINSIIRNNLTIYIKNMIKEKAYSIGARFLSKKIYKKIVRTVSIKDSVNKICSIELCAGTHVKRTGDIGLFKIISETSIANGVRRIEAVSGYAAETFIKNEELNLLKASQLLTTSKNDFLCTLNKYIKHYHQLKNKIHILQNNLIDNQIKLHISTIKIIKYYNFLPILVNDFSMEMLRIMLKKLEHTLKSIVILLISKNSNKILFLVFVSNDYNQKGLSAHTIAKQVAHDIYGAGGGNNNFAQGGSTTSHNYNIKNIINESHKYI